MGDMPRTSPVAAEATGPQVDQHVFLIGRPPMSEYISFVVIQSLGGDQVDHRTLSNEWRVANDHVRQLEQDEAGIADGIVVGQLPVVWNDLVLAVEADPMFQRGYTAVPVSIGLVELDRLVVFQKHIDLSHVARIRAGLSDPPSEGEIYRLALPVTHPTPPIQLRRVAQNAWVFVSPSDDFRFLEAALLTPEKIVNHGTSGPLSAAVALMVGYGSNYLNAIYANGRLVLNNGSHRAFALREAGVTHAPMVIQHVTREEELEMVSAPLQANVERYLTAARPPLLKDYFDPVLRKLLLVPRKQRQVKISFGVENVDVPG
jgi:hypothetical protein